VLREVPATERAPEKSKRGLYRIADPFVRFWFRHVRRSWGRLEAGQVDAVLLEVVADLDTLAASTYEALCRELVMSRGLGGRAWSRVGRWWDRGGEIDVLAFADDGAVLAGEAKWSARPVGTNVLAELERTVASAAVAGAGGSVTLALFSRSGFTPALRSAVAGRRDVVLVQGLEPLG